MSHFQQLSHQLNSNVRRFLTVPLAIGFSYSGIFVVLFNLFLLRLGYDARFIGMLSATGPIVFTAFSIPAGGLSRRWGSRRLIMVGVSCYIVSFSLLPWAELFASPTREIWLVVNYLLAFLGGAFFWPNSDTYLMQVTTAVNRNLAFSMRQAMFPLAAFVGSLIAGQLPSFFASLTNTTLEQPTPYRYALLLCGLIYIPAWLAMLSAEDVAPDEAQEQAATADSSAKQTSGFAFVWLILPLIIVEFFWKGSHVAPTHFFNVYLDLDFAVAPAQIGLILGIGQLFSAGVALITPWLATRLGNGRTILFSLLGISLSLLIIAWSGHWFGAGVGFMLLLGMAAISASTLAIFRLERIDPMWWGMASGIAVSAQGLGESAMLFTGGLLIDGFGFGTFFTVTAVILFLGTLFFFVYFRSSLNTKHA